MADEDEATPTLDAGRHGVGHRAGTRRQVQEGEYLYKAGDIHYDFFVLASAAVDIVVGSTVASGIITTDPAGSSAS